MKVISEGKLHKAEAVFVTCDHCGSKLRLLLDKGDPRVGRKKYNCDSGKEWVVFACAVCDKIGLAEYRSPYFEDEVNCELKEIVLEKEDLEEIKNYKNQEISEDLKNKIERHFWKI